MLGGVGSIQSIGVQPGAASGTDVLPVLAPAPAAPAAVSTPRLELEGGVPPCSPCFRESLRDAFRTQAIDRAAMQADVARQVATRYAAFRPA